MATDGAASIYAVRTRVARLDATGATPAGAASLYVSNALVRIEFTLEYETNEALTRKNGNGDLCVNVPEKRKVKQVTVSAFEVCTEDPELEELLAGGTILTSEGDTIGYAAPAVGVDPTPNGVSVEVWSRAIVGGVGATVNPYYHWAFPRLFLSRGSTALEEAPTAPVFTGYGLENPNWGNGPANDWEFDSERVYQYVRTAALPTVTDGVAAVPTQA